LQDMLSGESSVQIRVKGDWVTVPAVDVDGKSLLASGKWLKTAAVRGEGTMEDDLGDPEIYLNKLRGDAKDVLKADIFTFTQKPPETQPKYHYPQEPESVAVIHLKTFKEWWESLAQETRKNVRRAQKRGVEVRVTEYGDDLIQGIRQVNDESPLRQGTRNGYYGRSFEETKKLYGEFVGRSDFICAYHSDKLIGFLHLIYMGKVASILNLTTMPSHFDKRPANALLAKVVELSEAKGISYIVYGLYNYGNKRDHPLRTFKIRNGFEEILMPRYFVPLTNWGKLCMKLKLHRGLIGILPNSVITFVVGARARWYHFTAFISRRSSTTERPNCNRQMGRSIPPAGSST
jgi:hypothetical protein